MSLSLSLSPQHSLHPSMSFMYRVQSPNMEQQMEITEKEATSASATFTQRSPLIVHWKSFFLFIFNAFVAESILWPDTLECIMTRTSKDTHTCTHTHWYFQEIDRVIQFSELQRICQRYVLAFTKIQYKKKMYCLDCRRFFIQVHKRWMSPVVLSLCWLCVWQRFYLSPLAVLLVMSPCPLTRTAGGLFSLSCYTWDGQERWALIGCCTSRWARPWTPTPPRTCISLSHRL